MSDIKFKNNNNKIYYKKALKYMEYFSFTTSKVQLRKKKLFTRQYEKLLN